MTGPIRVGIVGANPERGWGRDAHLPALRTLPQFTLSASRPAARNSPTGPPPPSARRERSATPWSSPAIRTSTSSR